MKRGQFILAAVVAASMVTAGIAAVIMLLSAKNEKEDAIYQDILVEYGTLTAGITKTTSVSFETFGQTFDLDIGTLADESFASLQIEEVLVGAGQQVQKGTALFRVTSNSVRSTRTILQREVLNTYRDCELLKARQKELRLQAAQGYANDVIDGKYAGIIFDNKCEELQKKADDAKEAVDDKQNEVNENLLQLTQAQQELVNAQKYLKEAQAAVSENYDNRYDNAYYYTIYENTMETAQNMVEQLEKQIESLTKKNESLLYEVNEALCAYHQIVQDLEKEKLAAAKEYHTEVYASETASEWYGLQTEDLDNVLQEAEGHYQTALQNIRTFDSCIVHNQVLSKYNGIVSNIMIEAGNVIHKNDLIVTLYDRKSVKMKVLLSEEEYFAVNQEKTANISFSDVPNQIYEGRITEGFNMEYDNKSEQSFYIVTVTLQGDTSGLYKGMTGNVTFLTREAKDVIYVPNKAVFREGDRAYVKIRNKREKIVNKDVTTGFSDGIYIEIVNGLSAGDRVLLK